MQRTGEPTRNEKRQLVKELEERFDFSTSQARYLVINSYGYVSDIVNQLKQIEKSMRSLKKVLEGLEIT